MHDKLPTTERECRLCDGTFVQDGHELICAECQHSPSDDGGTVLDVDGDWRAHEQQFDDDDDRPRMVGGYPDAYWGSGRYEYSPTEGFRLS